MAESLFPPDPLRSTKAQASPNLSSVQSSVDGLDVSSEAFSSPRFCASSLPFFPFCTPGQSLTDFWPPLGSIHTASPTRPSRHYQPACTVRPARVGTQEDPASTTHFGRPRRQELGTILSESTTAITIDIIPQARPHRHGSIHLPLSWDSLPTRFTASAPLPACQPASPPTTTSHIRNLPRPIHRIHLVPQHGRFSAHPSSADCQTAQTASL